MKRFVCCFYLCFCLFLLSSNAYADYMCNPGTYLPKNTSLCRTCLANNYCVGGTFVFNASVDQGITQCPNGLFAPAGMPNASQCGRILHVGEDTVYLHQNRQTERTLNVDTDDDGISDFFGNMTTTPVSMNINTQSQLVLAFDGKTYYVYDDSMAFDFSTLDTAEQCDGPSANNERINFSYGSVYFTSACSATVGTGWQATGNIDENAGSYCWCKETGFIPNGSTIKYVPSNNVLWAHDPSDAEQQTCVVTARSCAGRCRAMFCNREQFRRYMYGIN